MPTDFPQSRTCHHDGGTCGPPRSPWTAGLLDRLALSDEERRREEDPSTDMLAGVGDQTFRVRTSRSEIDLNPPEDDAIYLGPSDAWGLSIRAERPTDEMVARSMAMRTAFYDMMRGWIEDSIAEHCGEFCTITAEYKKFFMDEWTNSSR